MDWHQHFQQVFFEQWLELGLPQPQLYTAAYTDAREHNLQNILFLETDMAKESGLSFHQLKSVYGFGKVTGEIIGELAGLSNETTMHVADWCGRFNLGISLFDYICDEHNGRDRVRSLPVFQQMLSSTPATPPQLNPAEQLLSFLAASVLKDVAALNNVELQTAMKQMLRAELLHASGSISEPTDLQIIKQALYLKSAEPFRVMALYAGLNGSIQEPLQKPLQQFGTALGKCYWLIDDARDLYDDVAAKKWNWFLTIDDSIAAITDQDAITQRLIKLNTAAQLCTAVIKELSESMNALDVGAEQKKRIAGFIGASLWQWFCY
jgi:hypothetical protein